MDIGGNVNLETQKVFFEISGKRDKHWYNIESNFVSATTKGTT